MAPETLPVARGAGDANAISEADNPPPPEGIHPNAGRAIRQPAAAARRDTATSSRSATASSTAKRKTAPAAAATAPTPKARRKAPNLTGKKIWSDGSLAGLEKTITDGVPKPRDYPGAMPAKGGAPH